MRRSVGGGECRASRIKAEREGPSAPAGRAPYIYSASSEASDKERCSRRLIGRRSITWHCSPDSLRFAAEMERGNRESGRAGQSCLQQLPSTQNNSKERETPIAPAGHAPCIISASSEAKDKERCSRRLFGWRSISRHCSPDSLRFAGEMKRGKRDSKAQERRNSSSHGKQ